MQTPNGRIVALAHLMWDDDSAEVALLVEDDHNERQGEDLKFRALIPAEERRAERAAEPNEQAGKAE